MFPRNDRMVNMKVVLPRDLAERLGFELNIEITPKNSIGEPLVVVDPKETEDRAKSSVQRDRSNHCVGLQYRNKYNGGHWQTIHGGLVPYRNGQHGDACQRNLQSTAIHDFANC